MATKKGFTRKNVGLITSREDSSARIFIYFILIIVGAFLFLSAYSLTQNATDAASWGMMILFGFIFAGILFREENVLPSLDNTKFISFITAGFLLFVGIPILVAFITSINVAVVILATLFIAPGMILLLYTFANDKQWKTFKTKTSNTLHIKRKKKRKVRDFKRRR